MTEETPGLSEALDAVCRIVGDFVDADRSIGVRRWDEFLTTLDRAVAEATRPLIEALEAHIEWLLGINHHYGQINDINFDPGLATDALHEAEKLRALAAPLTGGKANG